MATLTHNKYSPSSLLFGCKWSKDQHASVIALVPETYWNEKKHLSSDFFEVDSANFNDDFVPIAEAFYQIKNKVPETKKQLESLGFKYSKEVEQYVKETDM